MQVPTTVTTFFGLYPNASKVYLLATGESFLSNFEEEAIKAAKRTTTKLYKVNANNTLELHYPTSFRYELEYDTSSDPIIEVKVDGEGTSVAFMTAQEVQGALESALQSGGFTGSVTVTDYGTSYFIVVTLSDDIDITAQDSKANFYPFDQKFN